jgi:methylglutaconyl-CoA hydratase
LAAVVESELREGVFRIVLSRPEVHNALNEELIEGLRQAVERAASEREVQVVLLSGAGSSFCAGADVGWMQEMGAASQDENRRSAYRLARLYLALDRLEKPVVARVQGAAIGGGVGLVAVSDLAIASTRSVFALSELRLGVIPAVIAPYLVRRLGMGRARELILTSRRFQGEEAAALGLVSRAVDESLLDAAVERAVADLRAGGPQALAQAKRLLRDLAERPKTGEELADWTAQLTAETRAGEEARAGLEAFLKKSPPPWAPPARPRPS